jgi:hypothetical protein
MQIELLGCTGAGKSTLAAAILVRSHQAGIDVVMADDLILERVRLGWLKTKLVRTCVINAISLLTCLATWPRYSACGTFALRHVWALPVSWPDKWYLTRIVLKKLGTYEIARRHRDSRIVLVDEGTLQAAHNLFVHLATAPKRSDIAEFARLVPLPDVAIQVTDRVPELVARTLARGHRRIRHKLHRVARVFVERALETFSALLDQLVADKALLEVRHEDSNGDCLHPGIRAPGIMDMPLIVAMSGWIRIHSDTRILTRNDLTHWITHDVTDGVQNPLRP